MSKYEEIANQIRERIQKGIYKPGEALPEQNALSKEFKTSRVTLRKAIQLLIVEGLLFSKRGSGTYVRKNINQLSSNESRSDDFFGTTHKAGTKDSITSKIIKFEVRFPTIEESEALLIEQTAPIYDIIRVRYTNDLPTSLEYSKMPVSIISRLNKTILNTSIYSYIQQDLGLKIEGAHRAIQADKPTILDIEELEIEENDPILEVDQIVYLDNGTPFELSKSRYPYQSGKIIANVISREHN